MGIGSMIGDVKTIFNPNTSWSSRLFSIADLAVNVAMDVDTITGTGEAARAAYLGLKVGVKMAGKEVEHVAVEEGEHLAAKEFENTAAHEGEGEAEHVAEDAAGGCNSFQGDTPVATPSGAAPIATLKVGDQVIATDVATGKVQAEPVQHVFINHDSNLLDVTIAAAPNAKPTTQDTTTTQQQKVTTKAHGSQAPPPTETLHTTTEHPFLTAELGWVNAQDLKPGEHVRKLDGSLGVVTAVIVVTGTAVRYNLTVAQDHTFAVGDGQWVVHNVACDPGDYEQRVRDVNGDPATQDHERMVNGDPNDLARPDAIRQEGPATEVWIDAKANPEGATLQDVFHNRNRINQLRRYTRAAMSGQRVEYWFMHSPAQEVLDELGSRGIGWRLWTALR